MRGKHQYGVVFLAALALLVALSAGLGSARGAARAHTVQANQRLAMLLTAHQAFAQPSASSKRVDLVQAERPITGVRTALPVLAVRDTWLKVRLPGRPNSHTGWIQSQGTVTKWTTWRLIVRTASRHVLVYHHGHLVQTFLAIVGKPSTPTPHGQFFVEESIALRPTDVGAPVALALSARSGVFKEFEGGPGQVALHGLDNVGGTLGTAVSHGCVRLADDAVRWLGNRIDPGVPVVITN